MARPQNLATTLRCRRRADDPMALYDRLPPELRHWLNDAKLPWSPRSARAIWLKARRAGLSPDEALARLERAEARTLARDAQSQTI
ncbi:MAG: DUF6525 family protein [Pseudomonadota bacterium]